MANSPVLTNSDTDLQTKIDLADPQQMFQSSAGLQICNHHIYELKKGLRDLVLITVPRIHSDLICARLEQKRMPYYVQEVSSRKVNLFFGDADCIEIVKSFNLKDLTSLSPEQDFMLGVMLGYKLSNQYQRYLQNISGNK